MVQCRHRSIVVEVWKVKRFTFAVLLALAAALPGVVLRVTGNHITPILDVFLFGVAIVGAGFLLSWSAEAAEEKVAQGVALAGLALVTVLPEFAVDIYYTFQAGQQPGSAYVGYAAANMTGANRLLIGTAWPLIVLLFWWRSRKRVVALRPDNSVEIAFLAVPSLYAFVIVLKGQIDLIDAAILLAIFGAYVWRLSKLRKDEADDNDADAEEEIGPAAALETLPPARQWAIIAGLTLLAAGIIFAVAEPFAESLIAAGDVLGIDKFLLIQWLAPLAGEAPELVIVVLFCLNYRPTTALGAMISDKINQWTLLVGFIPLFFSLGAGRVLALPLDARQHEEFFLTAAQSLFAVGLLLRLRFTLTSGLILLGLFLLQLGLAFSFRANEAQVIGSLTVVAWLYLVGAIAVWVWDRGALRNIVRIGLLRKPQKLPKRSAVPPQPIEE